MAEKSTYTEAHRRYYQKMKATRTVDDSTYKIAGKRYYEKNKEKIIARVTQRYHDNKGNCKEQSRLRYWINKRKQAEAAYAADPNPTNEGLLDYYTKGETEQRTLYEKLK